jgi:hypothetical protein
MGLFDFFKGKSEKKAPTIPHEALIVWVHRRTHLEVLAYSSKARGMEPLRWQGLGDAFALTPALMTLEGPIATKSEHLEALGLEYNDATVRAVSNMARSLLNPDDLTGVYAFNTPPDVAGVGMLLGAALAERVRIKGRAVAMLPSNDLLLMAPEDDENALGRMLVMAENAFHGATEWRSLRACVFNGEEPIQDWLPPEGHPCHGRFRGAANETILKELAAQHEVYGMSEQAPRAHMAVEPPEKGGRLIAAWARGTTVAIPAAADRVVLLETPDAPIARLEVDARMLREVVPSAFQPMAAPEFEGDTHERDEDDPAVFYRASGANHPSARILEHLRARSAADFKERTVDADELYREWDSGAPIRVDVLDETHLVLCAPDGRMAPSTYDAARRRIEGLPPHDQADVTTGLMSARLMREAAAGTLDMTRPPRWMNQQAAKVAHFAEAAARNRVELLPAPTKAAPGEDALDGDTATAVATAAARMFEPTTLYPVLRPPAYGENSKQSIAGQVAHLGKLAIDMPVAASFPMAEGVAYDLVSDAGDRMVPLNARNFPESMFAAARATALLNVTAASLSEMLPLAPGAYRAPWTDGYAASRMLVPEVFAGLDTKGELLLFAPSVTELWCAGADDVPAQAAVLDAIDGFLRSPGARTPYVWRELLLGRPWVFRQGVPVPWVVPVGHPLADRIRSLDETLQKRRDESAAHAYELGRAAGVPGPSGAS